MPPVTRRRIKQIVEEEMEDIGLCLNQSEKRALEIEAIAMYIGIKTIFRTMSPEERKALITILKQEDAKDEWG